MAEPSSIASLKAYYNVPVHTIDVVELMETLDAESDRTAIVVYASLLEDALAQKLRTRLRPLDPREEKELRLFNTGGPFGGLSTRTNVAYALGLIDENTLADLQDLREMRNACAHSFKPIDLNTPELRNVCLRLFDPARKSLELQDERTHANLRGALMWKFTMLFLTITHGSQEEALKALVGVHLEDEDEAEPSRDK